MAEQVIAKYIRLSLDEAKTDSLSIENQRALLDRYLADTDMDHAEVLEFVDNGYTGTNYERPAVQELLELVRAGKVNCILVKDFSRFGRNAIETGYFIERVFPLFHVRFIAVSDGFDSLAHAGDAGGMEMAFKFLINEYYSRDLSMKIRSAKREKALRGEAVTKNCVYGYKLDGDRNMIIDPEAAETVRVIFEMYADKKSLADIEKRLHEEKRPTPAARKNHQWATAKNAELSCVWQKSVILLMLRDEQYIGAYIAGKTKTIEVGNPNRAKKAGEDWIRIPGHHPAIISQELFDAVQEQLRVKGEPRRRREVGTAQRYGAIKSVLTGKVVCGNCRHSMRLSSTKNAAFHCWFTRSAEGVACHRLRILKSELEEVIMESIRNQANTILDADAWVGDTGVMRSPAISEYEDRIGKLREEKQRLYETVVLGVINRDEYMAKKDSIDALLGRSLQVYEAILEENKKSIPDAASIQAARKALEENAMTQEVTDLLIEKILVYPDDRIEIVWKLSGFMNCVPRNTPPVSRSELSR